MSIQWTKDLETGIADIDTQHQELIERFNRLLGACVQQKGTDEVVQYLTFLLEYVAYHFAAEERDMHDQAYPGLKAHEEEHEQFKREINAHAAELRAGGASGDIVQAALWSSAEWLLKHVKGTDRAMAEFLRDQRSR